jgi:hypothetical protein
MFMLAAIVVGAFVFWRTVKGRPVLPGGRRTAADGAWAVVCLAMLIAAAYLAHRLGIFALPLVVLAFLPIGVGMRWLLLHTRGPRERRYGAAETLPVHPLAGYTVPLLALSAVAVAAIGVLVGALIGPN